MRQNEINCSKFNEICVFNANKLKRLIDGFKNKSFYLYKYIYK